MRKGYGIAAISRSVVAADLRNGTLVVVEVRGWDVRNTVSVLRVRDATLTPALQERLDRRQHEAALGHDGRNLPGRDGQRTNLDEARWRKDVAAADAVRMAYARTPPYLWLSRLGC